MPVLPSTPESKAALSKMIGGGLIVFGQKRPDSLKRNSPASPELPDLQNLPEDPIKGLERARDKRLQEQSTTDDKQG